MTTRTNNFEPIMILPGRYAWLPRGMIFIPVTSADLDVRADLPPPSPSIGTRLAAIQNRPFTRHRQPPSIAIPRNSSIPIYELPLIPYPPLSIMPAKNRLSSTIPASTTTPITPTSSRPSKGDGTTGGKGKVTVGNQDMYEIIQGVWGNYLDKTPQRTKLIDVFMAFLVIVGGIQFVYCVVAGNYVSTRNLSVGLNRSYLYRVDQVALHN